MLLKFIMGQLKVICVGTVLIASHMYGSISTVYNLRIAETTKRIGIEPVFEQPSLGTVTMFGTFRKKYNGDKHRSIGGLCTLVYAPESFFLRLDAAVGRVASNDQGVFFSRTQVDDLLFSAGYSPSLSEKMRLTFSGFLGLPTHKDTSLAFVQFGYGHYGLGAQIDGSFIYSHNKDHTLRSAIRCIHFFPRRVCAQVDRGIESFKYGLGDLIDLFIAFHNKINKHNIELGYNGSFFINASIYPNLESALQKANYTRHSFFGMYKYHFLINTTTNMLATALSYGFEPTPKIYGNKRLITVWASWSVNF